MNAIFEATYISIKWVDEKTPLSLKKAISLHGIEIIDKYNYLMELKTYTKIEEGLFGQIAFQILDDSLDISPYFIDASNDKVPMLKIKDPNTKKSWWIEKGKWVKSRKPPYRSSPLLNHPGEAVIMFGDIRCAVNISADSFTKVQFDLYLNDFRNDFWYLILQKDSITTGDAKNKKVKILNNDTSKTIDTYIEYAKKILEKPKVELIEVQRVKDIKKVRPVPRTFMEIATSGIRKKLTSRDYVESYNVAENRYIHHTIDKVYMIVSYMLNASSHMGNLYKRNDEHNQERLNSFSDVKTIDKEVYKNEIRDLEVRLREEKLELQKAVLSQNKSMLIELENQTKQEDIKDVLSRQQAGHYVNNPPEQYIIKLESRQNNWNNQMQFWGKLKHNQNEDWHSGSPKDAYNFSFDKNIFNNTIKEASEYLVLAHTQYYKNNKKDAGVIHKFIFKNIVELKLLTSASNGQEQLEVEHKTVHLKLEKKTLYNGEIKFYGKIKLVNGQWYEFKNSDFYSFKFNKSIFESVLQEYQEYKITAYIRRSKKALENKNIHERDFQYITNIEQITISSTEKALSNLKSQRPSLEATNWQRPLNTQEQTEQQQEKEALSKSIKLLKEEQKNNLELLSHLKPQLKNLKSLISNYEKLKIRKESIFPNSMTFVQNPNYQGAHQFYKKIMSIAGIDENLFIQLQLIDKIGLLDIPKIYERWCLLQIIKVLKDKYRFISEENWKVKLANQILKKRAEDIKICFSRDDIKKDITFWYEKNLKNGKRPDYVLDIVSTGNLDNQEVHRLVMDAKFNEKVDISNHIDDLYNNKGYSEGGANTMFILHPDTNKAVPKKKTPKIWGDDSYYGEVPMFKWDSEKKPNHKYGAILLSPMVKNRNYLDDLQRVIGMFLQYSIEDNDKQKDPKPKGEIFCIACGNYCSKNNLQMSKTKNNYGYRYTIVCDDCHHYTQYNYCWSCKNRLVKNGEYWSYHSAEVLNPFNIKCPNCSALFIKD